MDAAALLALAATGAGAVWSLGRIRARAPSSPAIAGSADAGTAGPVRR
ncbi:hypothetical protein [Streptomyces tunisiensis]